MRELTFKYNRRPKNEERPASSCHLVTPSSCHPLPPSPLLLIGVGNEYRRDDGVGLAAARAVQTLNLPGVTVVEASGEGAALIELWRGADTVLLIDAVFSLVKQGAENAPAPGTIHRFEVDVRSLPTDFFRCSTHAFGVAEAIELARMLNQLPPRFIVYGIEGKDFSAGEGLSPEVSQAATRVSEWIHAFICQRVDNEASFNYL